MVEIREVRSKRDLLLFAGFNEKMYRDNSFAVPDLLSDEMSNFNPDKNPAYSYCDSRQFLAYKDGKVVGRIAGIISNKANEKWGYKRIRFSRVDFIDDYEVSAALFKAVEDWGRDRKLTHIHGPIGFCDMDQEGMLIDGFDTPGMFISIWNAPYYKDHLIKLGYLKDVDWLEYRIKVPETPNMKLKKLSDAVMRRSNLRLYEPKSFKEINNVIKPVLELVNKTYGKLYGTVELSEAQIEHYYNQFKLIIDPDYVKILYNEKDEIVAFGLSMPSLSQAVKQSKGRLFPFGWYRILTTKKKSATTLDLYLVGVVPEYLDKGLAAVLIQSTCETAAAKGIRYAETGPELEDNKNVQGLWRFFETEQHKRRRCWIKEL